MPATQAPVESQQPPGQLHAATGTQPPFVHVSSGAHASSYTTRKANIAKGEVIVGVNGYRVHTVEDLWLWDGRQVRQLLLTPPKHSLDVNIEA